MCYGNTHLSKAKCYGNAHLSHDKVRSNHGKSKANHLVFSLGNISFLSIFGYSIGFN
jgi:hypothetical protein